LQATYILPVLLINNIPVFGGGYAAIAGFGSGIIYDEYFSRFHTRPVGQIRKYPVKGGGT
jgi:hypothetical protein